MRAALDSGIAKNGTQAAAFALLIADRRRLAATTQTAAQLAAPRRTHVGDDLRALVGTAHSDSD